MDWPSGQERRAWLDRQDERLRNALSYYLGPAAAPVNALAQVGAMISPGSDMMDMASYGRDLMESDSPQNALANAGWLGAATLGMALPGSASGYRKAADDAAELASRSARMYTFPTDSEVGDALGRSGSGGVDLEGRPLVARYVVGRAPDRTGEKSLPSKALAELVEARTGRPIQAVPLSSLPRGAYGVYEARGSAPQAVRVYQGLPPDQFDGVSRHEVGHMIDHLAGYIPQAGLSRELGPLYHYGQVGDDRVKHLTRPQDQGYRGDDGQREYMAETLRQYMSAPDAMKARAPKSPGPGRRSSGDAVPARHNVLGHLDRDGPGDVTICSLVS